MTLKALLRKGLNWLAGDGTEVNNTRLAMSTRGIYHTAPISEANVNSAVVACLRWVMRTVVEPPAVVVRLDAKGQEVIDAQHLAADLLRYPQRRLPGGHMSGARLRQAIASCVTLDGNAYLIKESDLGGRVAALSFVPYGGIEPEAESGNSAALKGYRVKASFNYGLDVSAGTLLPPEDVIHFADGVDPDNQLKGFSPLKALVRQVLTDNEASVYSHAILRNMSIPSFLVSPKGADIEIAPEAADQMRDRFQAATGGDARGSVIVPTVPIEITQIGFSPENLALDKMQRVPEERITAVLGIPAIVAGLGAGLDRSTFSNMKEAREAATEQFLVPMWSMIADTFTDSLAGDALKPGEHLRFDLRNVRALQEDEDNLYKRVNQSYAIGVTKRSEARAKLGLGSTPEDDVYRTDLTGPAAMPAEASAMARRSAAIRRKADV